MPVPAPSRADPESDRFIPQSTDVQNDDSKV